MKNFEFNLGIIEDPRSLEDQAKDYKHGDLAGGPVVEWTEKFPNKWLSYVPREQDGSLSCCAQGGAKGMETMGFPVESAHPIYRKRFNYPDGGMYLENIGQILKKSGTTTEALDKSQLQNESTMNREITVETPDKIGGYAFPKHRDIDDVASAVDVHKHCLLIFHCNKKEWTDIPQYTAAEVNFGHCVTAVDYTMYDGKKCLVIEDSTGHWNSFNSNGQRLISEDFLKARCAGAMYFTALPPKPKFTFTKTIKIDSIGEDVKMLQIRLHIGADGIFGKKTKEAVIKFQIAHGLVGDGIVGPLTNLELNK